MPFSKQEFVDFLDKLGLDPIGIEVAKLLSVTPKTVMCWIENPQEIPETVELSLRAWLCLQLHLVKD